MGVIPSGSSLGSGTLSQRFTMTCGAKSGVVSKSIVDETPASKKKDSAPEKKPAPLKNKVDVPKKRLAPAKQKEDVP